ncbi:MAG: DUF4388 domain-containing protein [Acidobacteria bacterium]|nr:MAG: DUF4388 domain-containing protein [Acidobacteriota bacterium]
MSIQGSLDTMKLQDLLRWVAEHSETGTLELERNKVCKRIVFHEGHIIGCSSDDPPSRIGQFLLARGKITREVLAQALEIQKKTQATLGAILQDMGVIEAEEFAYELGSKAEENLLSLFDWKKAVFRFKRDEPGDPWMLDVHMPVEELVERGRQRSEQLDAIRGLFVSSGVVLEHAEVRVPADVTSSGLVRGILGTIDGERTIGEVLFHTHASEFLVLRFLASAVHSGFVKIVEVRELDGEHPTLLDVADSCAAKTAGVEQADDPPSSKATVPAPESTFEEQLELAQHFLAQDEVEAALDVLDDCYEERPGDEFLGHLIQKAESAFIKGCREGELKGNFVPSRIPGKSLDLSESPFSAAERFLLGMMDEGHTIQTLFWLAPMREIDVYRAFTHMRNAGAIEMHDGCEFGLEGTKAPTVEWA